MSSTYWTILFISFTVATSSWAQPATTGGGPDTVTNLQFYFHDIVSGRNPTAVQIIKPASERVVQPASGSSPTTLFGAVVMADDPLTETADASSKVIGRAQGMYAAAGQSEISLLMAMSYGFTDGPYNGSSLSIMGKNPAMDPTRELPVLGGTGVFRMARGYAEMKTVSVNAGGDAVVHYNVTVYAPASNGQ
ncbi:unnamed protein product [Linum tenue]|uniref:Dirigent protein n=1 Tax=Linum tenue TaxID=586396 RepID=A0AAV0PE22_9ROSI|nr:unnamed protein product [Linum tenue]